MKEIKISLGVIATMAVVDGAAGALFYLWQTGSHGAGSLLLFVSWVKAALRALGAIVYANGEDAPKLSPWVAVYHFATEAIFIGAFAWAAHFWLAGALAITDLMLWSARGNRVTP